MISMYDQLKSFIRAMSSTPFVINDPSYDETSSSCSSFEEDRQLTIQSSPILPEKNNNEESMDSLEQLPMKNRMNDVRLERKLSQLTSENQILRAKIEMLRRKFGDEVQTLFQSTEQSSMVCPLPDQSSSISTSVNLQLKSSSIADLIFLK